MRYQSFYDRQAAELEAADKRMDPHGEMNTPEHLRIFEQDMKKYGVAGVEDVK